MKINFKRIVRRLTGISTHIFGVSWHPRESDREIVKKLIKFLEDRRALYNPYNLETPIWVTASVLQIRKKLTETLEKIEERSDIARHVQAMRAACRKFMDKVEKQKKNRRPRSEDFFIALGEMRAIFGIHIAQLCVKYGIDVEEDLAIK